MINVYGNSTDIAGAKAIAERYGLFDFVFKEYKPGDTITADSIIVGGTGAENGVPQWDEHGAVRLSGKDRGDTANQFLQFVTGLNVTNPINNQQLSSNPITGSSVTQNPIASNGQPIVINMPSQGSNGAGSIAGTIGSRLKSIDTDKVITIVAGLFFVKIIFGMFQGK